MSKPSASLLDAASYRAVLAAMPEASAWESLAPPPPGQIYLPAAHLKALSSEAGVVIGPSGSGKSFLTATLANVGRRQYLANAYCLAGYGFFGNSHGGFEPKQHRSHALRGNAAGDAPRPVSQSGAHGISTQNPKEPGHDNLMVRVGFGQDASSEDFSRKKQLSHWLSTFTEEAIWRGEVLYHALNAAERSASFNARSLESVIDYVSQNDLAADELLAECDRGLEAQNQRLLILFDALELLGHDWQAVRKHLYAILRLCQECRTRRAIRIKVFLRPDMASDPEIWRFPDAVKLRHSQTELRWRPHELYNLVLLYLANTPTVGQDFRDQPKAIQGINWDEIDQAYPVPKALVASEEGVRAVIEALTGQQMSQDARRGNPYSWVIGHLADAAGQVSPRSLLTAFKHAAAWTEQHQADHRFALHYDGIKHGVAEAAKVRRKEVLEDYPWVEPLLEAARGMTVPCNGEELAQRWPQSLLSTLGNITALPPRRYRCDGKTAAALIDDLTELAIIYRSEKGRIDIPEVFRVGFGIKRKGGVKPLR